MGLFVTEDGHFQGWLAAFLCCCAAVTEDEHPIERGRSRRKSSTFSLARHLYTYEVAASTRPGICNEQPQSLTALPQYPNAPVSAGTFKGDEPIFDEAREARRRHDSLVHDRPPSLKPLDFGGSSLLGKRTSRRSFGHNHRPSIGAPTAFRRLEGTDGQRQGLVPLKLGPVILRESPTPDQPSPATLEALTASGRKRSDSTQQLLSRSQQQSYREQRVTPFQRCSRSSTDLLSSPKQTDPIELPAEPVPAPLLASEQRAARGQRSRESSAGSLRRQAIESSAASTKSRTSSEGGRGARLKRKRSNQSVRQPLAEPEDKDLDKEILELNTIVEERRAEAALKKTPESHVPAIAPSMRVRARSETLNDIGSALSRPLTSQKPPWIDTTNPAPTEGPGRPSTSRGISSRSSRVSGWLSGLMSTSSQAQPSEPEPFYKCIPPTRQRAQSESSLCSSVSHIESPSLTSATSPTGHSRSLTAESYMTTLSPPSTLYGQLDVDRQKDTEDRWPTVTVRTSQVGLAM